MWDFLGHHRHFELSNIVPRLSYTEDFSSAPIGTQTSTNLLGTKTILGSLG